MPSWQGIVHESLTQGVDSNVYRLLPGETAHIQMERTGTCTDLILVQVFGTLEDPPNPRDNIPLFAFGLRSTETSISFILRGVWGYVIQLVNGAGTPTGTVTADMHSRRDGVDVG